MHRLNSYAKVCEYFIDLGSMYVNKLNYRSAVS